MTIPRLRLLPRARTGGYGNCNSPRITGMCLWLKSPLGHQQRPQLIWGFLRFWGVGGLLRGRGPVNCLAGSG